MLNSPKKNLKLKNKIYLEAQKHKNKKYKIIKVQKFQNYKFYPCLNYKMPQFF